MRKAMYHALLGENLIGPQAEAAWLVRELGPASPLGGSRRGRGLNPRLLAGTSVDSDED